MLLICRVYELFIMILNNLMIKLSEHDEEIMH